MYIRFACKIFLVLRWRFFLNLSVECQKLFCHSGREIKLPNTSWFENCLHPKESQPLIILHTLALIGLEQSGAWLKSKNHCRVCVQKTRRPSLWLLIVVLYNRFVIIDVLIFKNCRQVEDAPRHVGVNNTAGRLFILSGQTSTFPSLTQTLESHCNSEINSSVAFHCRTVMASTADSERRTSSKVWRNGQSAC